MANGKWDLPCAILHPPFYINFFIFTSVIKRNIPNLLTLCNLLCGCFAIAAAFDGKLEWSAYLVGIACVFDFLDGMAARLLNVKSEIGKQLDSLADVVSFGVVPGVIMFQMIKSAFAFQYVNNLSLGSFLDPGSMFSSGLQPDHFLPFVAFLIPVFSAVRLAKFNIDERQSDSFIGLPTPANAILLSSMALIVPIPQAEGILGSLTDLLNGGGELGALFQEKQEVSWMAKPYFLIGLSVISSISLISPIPLFALKFKNISWTDNQVRYIFLALAAALLIVFQYAGIPLIIILYIVLSLINNIVSKSKNVSPTNYE